MERKENINQTEDAMITNDKFQAIKREYMLAQASLTALKIQGENLTSGLFTEALDNLIVKKTALLEASKEVINNNYAGHSDLNAVLDTFNTRNPKSKEELISLCIRLEISQ